MAESAYQFIGICSIFPFIYVFLIAGVVALLIVGFVLLIYGLKSKQKTAKGHIFRIIRIVIGALFLTIAILFVAYSILGLTEMINRGGIFSDRNNYSSMPNSENALTYYLSTIL